MNANREFLFSAQKVFVRNWAKRIIPQSDSFAASFDTGCSKSTSYGQIAPLR
jgi:hypothetical protein